MKVDLENLTDEQRKAVIKKAMSLISKGHGAPVGNKNAKGNKGRWIKSTQSRTANAAPAS